MATRTILISVVAAISVFAGTAAEAQDCRPMAASSINSQGYRITGYTARVSGSGCVGSQNYVKIDNPSDRGVSARRWTSVSKQPDGSMRCSGGTWYYGGPRAGQPGGSERDIVIAKGKILRC